ncbi:sensor histidine kinase [Haloarcula limicola]|uniref:sensor histidine kinase n=1 Tax=Haloarcula limicola TaxID=1429915 RepID=UPI00240F0E55|nr:sensor histidine kinase [Halomicroarcula limicola]
MFRNAIEHGTADTSVRLGLLDDERGLYVEDDGPGIPPEVRERVFESGHMTKADGTGFGLATVRQTVDAHGWSVDIRESVTGGARFEITGIEFDDGDER